MQVGRSLSRKKEKNFFHIFRTYQLCFSYFWPGVNYFLFTQFIPQVLWSGKVTSTTCTSQSKPSHALSSLMTSMRWNHLSSEYHMNTGERHGRSRFSRRANCFMSFSVSSLTSHRGRRLKTYSYSDPAYLFLGTLYKYIIHVHFLFHFIPIDLCKCHTLGL